ncbi:glycosyltransferase family 39 protein [Thermoanaerobacterium sp. CMT5567-10]|uniref:glycosyltransferase family 39 protein n=1 Tax=Thermoanaerobacterium sp. CMT5567-10 TaxID=3061989 RepID=UPI0026E0C76D|nr:glycosyltransferase family 39 protein [Thermoanaerobacterium sp. CMT5567-10]WKV10266.1 glycosyltransferase family 39 protein [Thermoanaerobacterium sp. CMT5567-10]
MKKLKFNKDSIGLYLILLLSAILNFTNLSIEGYANQYYAAGVKSMSMSLKNFFFVSYDPAGFVTIDKPPLGFWIQTIFVKIFGFNGISILLPQAIAGVISVALIYILVKRYFGKTAGLISALVLAVTPVFVADSRNNTIDNMLLMTLLFAVLALMKALDTGKLKYLLLSLFLVGVGFNVKMLEAYMIIPAVYITYVLASKISLKKRIGYLSLATVVLLIVSLSWAIIVDMTPQSMRPYVGSSTDNSELELIIGHNGLERLGLGRNTGFGGGRIGNFNGGEFRRNFGNFNGQFNQGTSQVTQTQRTSVDAVSSATKNGNGSNGSQNNTPSASQGNYGQNGTNPNFAGGNFERPNGNRGGMGGAFGGDEKASILRLFSNNSLSDQIIWLFPMAIFGILAELLRKRLKRPFDDGRKLSLILWISWLVPVFIYFSFTTGMFHPYYLTMMAQPIAALTGIGIVSMWEMYQEGGAKSWLLPLSLIADGLVELLILYYHYNTSNLTKYIMLAVAVLSIGSAIVLSLMTFAKNGGFKVKKAMLIVGVIGLLIAPAVWSATTLFYPMNGTMPSAGLELATGRNRFVFGGGDINSNADSKLISFLEKNKGSAKYLLVVSSSQSAGADSIIIKTGEPVMALGGFSGSDNILTLSQFKELVKKGEVRYVMTGGMDRGSNSEIMNWVRENGKLVPTSEWSSTSATQNVNGFGGFGGRDFGELYDLKGVNVN